jgi:hypothetical protein
MNLRARPAITQGQASLVLADLGWEMIRVDPRFVAKRVMYRPDHSTSQLYESSSSLLALLDQINARNRALNRPRRTSFEDSSDQDAMDGVNPIEKVVKNV